MVDFRASTITLSGLTSPTITVSGSSISSITVHWGRQSIFDAPRKRSCQIVLVSSTLAKRLVESYVTRYIKVDIPVADKTTKECIFKGVVTEVEISPLAKGKMKITLTCDEAASWDPAMTKTYSTQMYSMSTFEARFKSNSGSINPEFVASPGRFYFYQIAADRNKSFHVTVQHAAEALVSWPWLAHASWSPDRSKIAPTIWKPRPPGYTRVSLGPEQLGGKHMSATVSTQTHVSAVSVQCDGTVGRNTQNSLLVDIVGRIQGLKVKVNKLASVSSQYNSIDDAVALVKEQVTDPRRATLSTDVDKTLATSQWLGTWEQPFIVNVPSEPVAAALGVKPDFHIIGGTLRVTPNAARHDVYMCWAKWS